MDNHKDEKPVFISGKEVRKCLLEGRPVDPRDHARKHRGDSHRGDGAMMKLVLGFASEDLRPKTKIYP